MSIAAMRSKKTSRYKNKHEDECSNIQLYEQLNLFWSEKSDDFLLPYLDKSDLMKLSAGKSILFYKYL